MGVPPLQTFQQPGPLDQAAKALQFKQMMGNNQIQQQNIQEGDIALQQKQQDMKDQMTIRQLFIKNQGDMDKTLNDAISAGVKPQTVQAIKAQHLETQQKLANLDKTQLEGVQKRSELFGQTSGSILALPPEQRKQAAMQALPGLVQQGVVKPEEAQQLAQQLPQMDDMALEQFLKLHQYSAMATEKLMSEIRAGKEAAIKQPGELGDSIEKANRAISQTMGGTTNPAAWKAKRAFLAQRGMDVSQVPDEYSPEAVQQMKQLGMPGYVAPGHVTMAEGVFTTNPDGTPNKRIGSPTKALVVPQAGSTGDRDIKDTADMIERGEASPNLTDYSFRDRTKLAAELGRRGYNQSQAALDWKSTQRYLSTLNGPQQVRLRQSIEAAGEMADKVESLYNEWQQLAPTSGFKVLNKASLTAMKNLPGRAGAVATNLESQIADLTADIGNIYMGGNSPTDHSLDLAGKNLKAEWNDQTFREALKQVKANVNIRRNSIKLGKPEGIQGDSRYNQPDGGGQQPPPQGGGFDWNAHPVVK